MSEQENSTLSPKKPGKTLSLKRPVESDSSKKTIEVQVKRRRSPTESSSPQGQDFSRKQPPTQNTSKGSNLTGGEFDARVRALQEARKNLQFDEENKLRRENEQERFRKEQSLLEAAFAPKKPVVEEKKKTEVVATESEAVSEASSEVALDIPDVPNPDKPLPKKHEHKGLVKKVKGVDEDEPETINYRVAAPIKRAITPVAKKTEPVQKLGPKKFSRQQLNRVMDDNFDERGMRRKKHKHQVAQVEDVKVVREVIIPEAITVGELANRMAVRSADVVKELMKLGVMATINQAIDADTAELLCTEFGHIPKRVSESDIEIDLMGIADEEADLKPRAPVVTIMGHVDHGKTSLLDALRHTDVVAGEAGGITQHIGAYQVTLSNKKQITFIDTPGHAAFSEMRARGANVTDIVVLVVAADDGIMEQTVEAINHAKAANVPIIVAINKIDKPDANPTRVRHELMSQNILLEEFGGEILSVEVSAKAKTNLEKLEEIILLQAEVLDLKANPNRSAQGVVVEARIDKGRGIAATVLIQKGTLQVGDTFVVGTEWGRVRALVDHYGRKISKALPSMPVEVLGFNGVPVAGDELIVLESESKAREIAESRLQRKRDLAIKISAKSSMEKLMGAIASGETKELGIIVKTDVHGSLEAIQSSLTKLGNSEISVRVLHGGVGPINESDVTLARASSGIVIGFNVRANPLARDLAKRDNIDLKYYSIIYNVMDDMKAIMGGMLAPTLREKYLGQAQIREVFKVPKAGKAAGCMITDGIVKRGSGVRLLRDNVVIHEGTLKSLRRFKDEVKEVKEGFECGMAFENYQDIKEGDMIECFEMESIAREL